MLYQCNLDYLTDGNAHNITIVNAKEEFVIDSISAVATSSSEKNTLVLKSPFWIEADGKYKLSK
jgi:hypothetical protein